MRLAATLAHPTRLAAALLALTVAGSSSAAEEKLTYPAKVRTMQGRIYDIRDLGHAKAEGYFVFYDGETEGRVSWRDLDSVLFVGNLGHRPEAIGPERTGTERVMITYVDGHERLVDLVVGDIHGRDLLDQRLVRADRIAEIDFDEDTIAPKVYKVSPRGQVWERPDFRYDPYTGLPLDTLPAAGGKPSTGTVTAVHPELRFPARVQTMQGRRFDIEDLGHELGEGAFVFYDGETEGRVSWRDLDRVVFAGNIGHRPDAIGPRLSSTRRAVLHYVDGHERVVNLVVGRLLGHDGVASRSVQPDRIAYIQFDTSVTAPRLYKVSPRGQVWENESYRYDPYTGEALTAWRVQ